MSQYTNLAVCLSSVSSACWVFARPCFCSHIEYTSIRRRKKRTRGCADMKASSVKSPTRHAVQLLCQVQVN
ncbi:hypothetical protein BGZ57DRAFT_918724 [Hyaloscypha finlandica]|nr:hypothetical protein BGZ57DRAFT_918724 [Hyaloscypha finlandica]